MACRKVFIKEQPENCGVDEGPLSPRAGRLTAAGRMLCIRGKREYRRERKQAFSPGGFPFSVRPRGLFHSFPSMIFVSKQIPLFFPFSAAFYPSGRKKFVRTYYYFVYWVQGGSPCRRGSGDEQSPDKSFAAKFPVRMEKSAGKWAEI